MTALGWSVLFGALAAGFVQGLSGFAFGLVAMTVWVWTVAPQLAGPLVVFGSLVGQLLLLRSFRHSFDGRRLWPFVLGGAAGTPIGVWMLHYVDPTVFKLAVGLILVAYCPAMLFIGAAPRVTVGGRLGRRHRRDRSGPTPSSRRGSAKSRTVSQLSTTITAVLESARRSCGLYRGIALRENLRIGQPRHNRIDPDWRSGRSCGVLSPH